MAKKDLDKNASKRFVMQSSEMSKGKTNREGNLAMKDLHKRMRAQEKGK